ncbi:SecY-interacting protein [Motilimonas pumila]|uniref:SecY-interacting protein n=1 Tax=Motilimonas pumila TaxID=2303987 RepID=UPI0013147B48|nr:SecY-interacting protein [Motilimonas pumila]
MSASSASESLSAFYARCATSWQQQNQLPMVAYDSDWPSPCEKGEPVEAMIQWQPHALSEPHSLDNIARALEMELHPDLSGLFCYWYADVVSAELNHEGRNMTIELVQAWNAQDFERLQENIIAHVMMQRRIGQAETVFIASCEDEMQIISLVNDSGEIVLEQLGKGIITTLAGDLASFLSKLKPAQL